MRKVLLVSMLCATPLILTISAPVLAALDPDQFSVDTNTQLTPEEAQKLAATSPSPLAIVAGIVSKKDMCIAEHPQLANEMTASYNQWQKRNSKLYASASKNPNFQKVIASAKNAYAQNNMKISENDCRNLISRLGYVSTNSSTDQTHTVPQPPIN